MKNLKLIALALLMSPTLALAWWNGDWKERTQVILNTSPAGVETKEAISGYAVPVRLHSGNFDFLSAKSDGSDLRVLAADDKTVLPFWVERYDSVNELAVVWVQVANVLPGTDKNIIYVYAGNDKAPPADDGRATTFDAATSAAFHFNEKDGIATDQSGNVKAASAITVEPNGLIGQSAKLVGSAVTWPANDKLKISAGGPATISFWLRPDAAQGTLFSEGPLQIALQAGKLSAAIGSATVSGGDVAPGTWTYVALTIGQGKLTLYVNGQQAGQGDIGSGAVAIAGDVHVGDGYQGLIDELQIASTLRSADWVKLSYAAQSADAKLIATKTETPDTAESSGEGGSTSYFGILIKNLTVDGWVVIGLLMIMFVIAVAVMVGKAMFINKTSKANKLFLKKYRDAQDLLRVKDAGSGDETASKADPLDLSPLYRLYAAAVVELRKRNIGQAGKVVSGATLDAVKAAVDADMVRETNRLNSQMVLLTIAISGGPFLGLLGTVVGVMITFAAIAAAGDVNVNAIAPGIAAALLATVAGLAVAIPALFGYNYLAAQIKVISSEMQIFVDEFITRVAETYGSN